MNENTDDDQQIGLADAIQRVYGRKALMYVDLPPIVAATVVYAVFGPLPAFAVMLVGLVVCVVAVSLTAIRRCS